jgi:hypothetical protein
MRALKSAMNAASDSLAWRTFMSMRHAMKMEQGIK